MRTTLPAARFVQLVRRVAGVGLLACLSFGVLVALPGEAAPGSTATTTAPSCGSTVFRKPDGTRWRCTFADYFSGTSLDTRKWTVMTSAASGFGKRQDCFMSSKSNVLVTKGLLWLTSRRAAPFTCGRGSRAFTARATSGMVSTMGKFAQDYGRFEFRASFPYTTQEGLQSSLWLWPQGATGAMWPVTGEIDVAEWYSSWPDRVIPRLHYATAFLLPRAATNNRCLVPNVRAFHTYLLEWTPSSITISYDGRTCLRNTSWRTLGSAPFDKPYFLAMMQALGVGKNPPTSRTPMPASTMIDYVRIWS
ncbi:MAG: glycoside hydrolase family 16 protein [Nocardioidaceae bacterium]|nr:glycoside hydrolase family 16 protein [Nocardioidaceae bacterium]